MLKEFEYSSNNYEAFKLKISEVYTKIIDNNYEITMHEEGTIKSKKLNV